MTRSCPDSPVTATSRTTDRAHTRVCAVDGWKTLPDLRRHPSAVCLRCQTRLARQLLELGELAGLLPAAALEPTTAGDVPIGVDAFDLALPGRLRLPAGPGEDQVGMTPVATMLLAWVADWIAWGAPAASVGFTTFTIARSLARRLSWACRAYDPIGDFSRAVRSQLRTVRRLLAVDVSPERLSVPCGLCGERSLIRDTGHPCDASESPSDGLIECTRCGAVWDEPEYAAAKARHLRAAIPADVMLTAAEIAIARPGLLAGTVRQWRRRGRLLPVPGPWGGKALYVLSEVDALVEAEIAARLAAHEAEQETAAESETIAG